MSNIPINITENGTITLATAGKYCDRNVDVNVSVESGGGGAELATLVDGSITECDLSNSTITTMRSYVFDGCKSLVSVLLPETLTEISRNAFCGCSALWDIVIPDSVKKIDATAFANSGLKSITLGKGITNMGSSIFNGFPKPLTNGTVYYRGSIEDWCNIVVYNYTSMPFDYNTNGPKLYLLNEGNEYYLLEEVNIPDAIFTIADYKFYGLHQITRIVASHISVIGKSAFGYCTKLKVLDFSGASSIPTLTNVNAFSNVLSTYVVVVPDTLYDSWIVATNWASISSHIVKASEHTEE